MLNIITLSLYSAGTLAQASAFFANKGFSRFWSLFGLPAVLFHGYLLYRWIDLSAGQNLTEFNLLSLAVWITAIFILILSVRKPVAYLSILIFPLAALSIALASLFPSDHIIQTASDPRQFCHILLSVITFSVLSLAGLQAVTLAFQETFLRRKYFEISRILPPIETMEKLLFDMIAIGAFFLSLVLVTSVIFFHSVLLDTFLQKTILTCIAWLVFMSLLVGRHFFGWRGRKAIYCTFAGVAVLTITYFSSIIIMGLCIE